MRHSERLSERLYDRLEALSREGRIPFHMPGHGRSGAFDTLGDAARIDFTEIEGLDNLHAPEGILKEAMDRAAEVWGADRAFFLVGGSTVGMLAAVRALCAGGRPLLLARNAHRSAYHAALLARAPLYCLNPPRHPLGFSLDVTPDSVREALDAHPGIRAVAVTSPTYDGVVSDIRGIAGVCRERGIPLLVDAAHGAHLGFFDPAVPSPASCGADIVVMSLHKTLPALTQTALLTVSGSLVDPDAVAEALGIFETSSPSYPLMASADGCAHLMRDGALFAAWRKRLARLRESSDGLFVKPGGVFGFDESKLLLRIPGMGGDEITAWLRTHGIEPEMTAPDYTLLMTGAGTTDAHIDALLDALRPFFGMDLPADFPEGARMPAPALPPAPLTLSEGAEGEAESVPLEEAAGRICAEFITPYPPGIPLVVPGEVVTEEAIEAMRKARDAGIGILLSRGAFSGRVRVLKKGDRP